MFHDTSDRARDLIRMFNKRFNKTNCFDLHCRIYPIRRDIPFSFSPCNLDNLINCRKIGKYIPTHPSGTLKIDKTSTPSKVFQRNF